MKIEILTTPNDALKETGFGTRSACNSVLDSVNRMGHTVSLTVCKTLNDLHDVVRRKPDFVVLAVKYIVVENEEKIWLSEFFFENEIAFSGSSRSVLEFDSNKVLAKSHLGSKGIKTADFFTAVPGQYKRESDLPIIFPLFLKPQDAANGNGVDDLSFAAANPLQCGRLRTPWPTTPNQPIRPTLAYAIWVACPMARPSSCKNGSRAR